MLKTIPDVAKLHAKTSVFTADTLPNALQQWHQTDENTWAKIVLSQGAALYEILTNPKEAIHLSPGQDGIIEPQQPHRLIPEADAQVQLFFYRVP
ncbi:MAG: DUF1971 domain-containing protein [Chloroflexota bacterium]